NDRRETDSRCLPSTLVVLTSFPRCTIGPPGRWHPSCERRDAGSRTLPRRRRCGFICVVEAAGTAYGFGSYDRRKVPEESHALALGYRGNSVCHLRRVVI